MHDTQDFGKMFKAAQLYFCLNLYQASSLTAPMLSLRMQLLKEDFIWSRATEI
jgi:hypothetical protein